MSNGYTYGNELPMPILVPFGRKSFFRMERLDTPGSEAIPSSRRPRKSSKQIGKPTHGERVVFTLNFVTKERIVVDNPTFVRLFSRPFSGARTVPVSPVSVGPVQHG